MKQHTCTKYLLLIAIITWLFTVACPLCLLGQPPLTAPGTWQTVTPASGAITGTEENSYAAAGDKFYLMGGRGIAAVQEYNPINKTWMNKAKVPIELNHFQAVTLNGLIYAAGAMNKPFPHEIPLTNVYMYNPVSDKWLTGSAIPASRRRGAAGAVAYKNKIYLVGGITDGHWAGWVNWFDEYDPATNSWKIMPAAPRVRDHFQVVIVNDKLYAAGGRRSSVSTGQTFALTIPEVDVYDFALGSWSTLPASSNLPVPRAGAANAALGNEVIVIGGESGTQSDAHKETHALDVTTNQWRRLADLQVARHGTGAVVSNQDIYIAAGAGKRGSTPKVLTQEDYFIFSHTAPNGSPLLLSPLSGSSGVSFGSIAVNSESSKTLTLTNTGSNQDILISSIALSGTSSFSYTAPFLFPFTISIGKSINVIVKFKPTTAGAQTANLIVTHSGENGSKTVSLSGTGTSTTNIQVTGLTLINTATHNETPLINGDVINLASSGSSLSIRANTSPATVGSVVLRLSGQQSKTQTESVSPYALYGDNNGVYNPWSPAPGNYTLTATPYSSGGGNGTAGTGKTVSFSVINQTTASSQKISKPAEERVIKPPVTTTLKAYPNPGGKNYFTVLLPKKIEGEVSYTLMSLSGNKLTSGKLSLKKTASTLSFDFSQEMILPGLYYLQLENNGQKANVKLMRSN